MRTNLRINKRASASVALAALLFAISTTADANLLVNGSFEADPFNSSGGGYSLGLVGNAVTGWFIPNGDGTYPWGLQNANSFSAGPAADGNQWLVLGEWGVAEFTIQQTINGLVPGNIYSLDFEIASERGCCAMAEVSYLSGSLTPAQTFTAPSSGDFWTQWGAESTSFLATNSSVTIQFKNVNPSNPNGLDLGLDNVVVLGLLVPEPSTFALAIGAIGLCVFRLRRR